MRAIATLALALALGSASAAALASCAYDPEFPDCKIACTIESGCPADMTCGSEGYCRADGVAASCAAVLDAGDEGDALAYPDAAPGPDADPQCLECDILTGGGCGEGYLCTFSVETEADDSFFAPTCVLETNLGPGVEGQACDGANRCAAGFYCNTAESPARCRQACIGSDFACPSGGCQTLPSLVWGPCEVGYCY